MPLRSLLLALIFCVGSLHAQEAPKVMTSTAAIRALDRDTAEKHLPVEVKGIVTFAYARPAEVSFVVEQDGTGIFVAVGDVIALREFVPRETLPVVKVGDRVEIRGVTAAGGYSPCVLPREIQITGTALPLPPTQPFILGDVLSGAMDCKRVEVRGVVHGGEARAAMLERLHLNLATAGQQFVTNLGNPGEWTPELLIGASVKVVAVCLPIFNQRGELLGVRLQVARPEDLVIEKPAPVDPFSVPEVDLMRMQPFSPEGYTLERRRLVGTVSLCQPGEFLFVEDHGRAVRVNTRSTVMFAPGERVEASGFIEIRDNFAELQNSVVRSLGKGPPPTAVQLTRETVLLASHHETAVLAREDYSGKLIALEGRFERVEQMENDGRRLFFISGGQAVAATLNHASSAELDDLRTGSTVRVTGICEVRYAGARTTTGPAAEFPRPTGITLLLRSAGDVEVLRAATWWTTERLWLLLAGISVALAAVLGWNWLLRRRVEQRSTQLAEEMRARNEAAVEFKSTLRERERLAADLHDTLEQSLTGLAFQLETAQALRADAPDRSGRHLGLARQLLTRSRDEVRRSIWNLRSQSLEGRNLPEALRDIAASQAEGRLVRIVVETKGTQRPLADFLAGNLLLFVQESLTNALKHSAAREILVHLDFEDDGIHLTVEDDGSGFDPEQTAGPKEGHFGLQGMRERIKRLGGTLEIQSSPGKGTKLSAQIPKGIVEGALTP